MCGICEQDKEMNNHKGTVHTEVFSHNYSLFSFELFSSALHLN